MLPSNAKWIIVLATAPSLASMCSGKDKAKCDQAQATVRTALEQNNPQLARQWRDYAWKQCDDKAALAKLDQDIVAKESEIAAKAAAAARTAELLKLFASFMSSHVGAPTGQCAPEDSPDKGWCTRSRTVTNSTSTFDVRYRQDDPATAKFTTLAQGDATCADLGGTLVREWKVTRATGGLATRLHCKLAGAGLDGFEALISIEPDGTRVTAVSSKWMTTDPGLRRQLDSEGK